MSFASELRHVEHPACPAVPFVRSRRVLPDAPPTPYPFTKAFVCAAVACILGAGALVLFDMHGNPQQAALGPAAVQALAFAAVASFAPAVVTGMVVQQSPRAWRFRDIALVFAAMFALTAALHALGLAGA